jgi:putative ABC transport system ATP-binding protein
MVLRMDEDLVIVDEVYKSYMYGKNKYEVLKGVNLKAGRGEFLAIQGPSGSGKTTLIYLIAGIDVPDKGYILVNGSKISAMKEGERTRWRRRNIGIVFQFYHLLPTLTAIENILLSMELAGIPKKERHEKARMLLEFVGLEEAADKFPSELSGGEQQRIAIARALAAEPPIILADEPTANLDTTNKKRIVQLLHQATERGTTVIMTTHDPELARSADRVVKLKDGVIMEE